MVTGIQMVMVSVSHARDKIKWGIWTGNWQDINNGVGKGRGGSRDELGIVIRQSAELFASPWQESCQSAVRVVRDTDHVPLGPHLQTN